LLFILALPSNLIVLLSGVKGIQARSDLLYLSQDELAGFTWLAEHAPQNAVILAGRRQVCLYQRTPGGR
jgi:hypothetical protein